MNKLLVKRIRSKLYEWRNIIGMVVWDVMLGAALVFFLYVALMNVSKYIVANCVNGIYGSNHRIFDCGKICVVLSKNRSR